MDVSIIMPVYEVKEYIAESVGSVCMQQFTGSFELILVNDGTKDDSIKVAESVLMNYPKMSYRVIDKLNGGLSSARNAGFEQIDSKYVCFIDSDDIIAHNHVQKLYDLNEKNRLMASYADFELTYLGNRAGVDFNCDGNEVIERKELIYGFLRRTLKIHCCSIMFNVQYLISEKLYFNELLKYGEDIEFLWRIFPKLSQVGHLKEKTYKYLQRPNSIMTSQSHDKIVLLYKEFGKIAESNLKMFSDDKEVFHFLAGRGALTLFKTAASTSYYSDFRSLLGKIDYKNDVKSMLVFDHIQWRMLAYLLLIHPYLFYITVNINNDEKRK